MTQPICTFKTLPIDLINYIVSFCDPTPLKLSSATKSFNDAREVLKLSTPPSQRKWTDRKLSLILQKFKNLTSFTLNGGYDKTYSTSNIGIEFSKCKKLEKVQLLEMSTISTHTLEYLSKCKNLTELSITSTSNSTIRLANFLCTNHGLNLKVLDLTGTECNLGSGNIGLATKHLTNLEVLSITHIGPLSNEALVQLANNCKKLIKLAVGFLWINDDGLRDFAKSAPNLRKLCAIHMRKITHVGLQALAQHCPNLEALHLIVIDDTPLIASVLSKDFKKLRHSYIHSSFTNCETKKQLIASESLKTRTSFKSGALTQPPKEF